eukprot:s598_g7.t1
MSTLAPFGWQYAELSGGEVFDLCQGDEYHALKWSRVGPKSGEKVDAALDAFVKSKTRQDFQMTSGWGPTTKWTIVKTIGVHIICQHKRANYVSLVLKPIRKLHLLMTVKNDPPDWEIVVTHVDQNQSLILTKVLEVDKPKTWGQCKEEALLDLVQKGVVTQQEEELVKWTTQYEDDPWPKMCHAWSNVLDPQECNDLSQPSGMKRPAASKSSTTQAAQKLARKEK